MRDSHCISQLLRACTFSRWRKDAPILNATDAADLPSAPGDAEAPTAELEDEPAELVANRSQPSELTEGWRASAAAKSKPFFLNMPAPLSYASHYSARGLLMPVRLTIRAVRQTRRVSLAAWRAPMWGLAVPRRSTTAPAPIRTTSFC